MAPNPVGLAMQPAYEAWPSAQWMRQNGWNRDAETLGERNTMTFIGEEWASVSAAAPLRCSNSPRPRVGCACRWSSLALTCPHTGVLDGRAHVTDLVPTMLDIAGAKSGGARHSRPQPVANVER